MPKLRQRGRRADDDALVQLRAIIAVGAPWVPVLDYDRTKGRCDLIFLVRGFFYFGDYLHAADDVETAIEIWAELREEILEQHTRYQPGSRPWAWWGLEDRPQRHRLTTTPCGCIELPDSSKFPPANLSWFGQPMFCRCGYETQAEYLARLSLLMPAELAAPEAP